IDRPFRLGDRIRLPGQETGRVEEMGLRSTHLRLSDGNLLVVPNNDLVMARLVNYTTPEGARGEVRFQVPPATDLQRLSAALLLFAQREPGVLSEPAPRLLILGLAEKLDLTLSFVAAPDAEPPEV